MQIQNNYFDKTAKISFVKEETRTSSADSKTRQAAKKTLDEGFKSRLNPVVKRVFTWIRSIQNRIIQLFKNCCKHKPSQTFKESTKIEVPKIQNNTPKTSDVPKENSEKIGEQTNSTLDPNTTEVMIHSLNSEMGILKQEIKQLKFNQLSDLEKLEEIRNKIAENENTIAELLTFLKNTDKEKVVKQIQQNLNQINHALTQKVQSLQSKLNLLIKASKKSLEDSQEFDQIDSEISPKTEIIEKDQGVEKAEGKKRRRSRNKQACLQDDQSIPLNALLKKEMDQNLQSLELIKNLVMPPTYINKNNNCWFHSCMGLLWKWSPQFSDLVKKKMAIIEQLQKSEIEMTHEYPVNPVILLEALQAFTHAMDSGRIKAIRLAADNVQKAVIQINPELNVGGKQQDAAAFLQFILEFLSQDIKPNGEWVTKPFFEIVQSFEGLGEFKGYNKTYDPEPYHMLMLSMYGKSDFQEILNQNYSPVSVNDPDNGKWVNGVAVTNFIECQRIKADTPPPFLFVQMKRFEYPSKEEIDAQKAKIEEEKEAKIEEFTDRLMKKNRKKYEDREVARLVVIDELTKRGKLPKLCLRSKKIDTLIDFSSDEINFAIPFGADPQNPNYRYKLRGVTSHHGTADEGHYTSTLLGTNPENGLDQWYDNNDLGAKNTEKTPEVVLQKNDGYLFFFELVKNPQEVL